MWFSFKYDAKKNDDVFGQFLVISLSNILHSVNYAPLFSPHLSNLYGILVRSIALILFEIISRNLVQM